MTKGTKPSIVHRMAIKLLKDTTVFNDIINGACGEAYDIGYKSGLEEGMKINGTPTRKIKRAIKNAYNKSNLKTGE
tara:strand:- start:834 stop:1061 length:228 start_codon:yes stop_codon:yes gene_type:complete